MHPARTIGQAILAILKKSATFAALNEGEGLRRQSVDAGWSSW